MLRSVIRYYMHGILLFNNLNACVGCMGDIKVCILLLIESDLHPITISVETPAVSNCFVLFLNAYNSDSTKHFIIYLCI